MGANTVAARSMITNFVGLIVRYLHEDRSRVILGEVLHDSGAGLLLQRIRSVTQEPGKIVLETGAFKITVKIDVQEKRP